MLFPRDALSNRVALSKLNDRSFQSRSLFPIKCRSFRENGELRIERIGSNRDCIALSETGENRIERGENWIKRIECIALSVMLFPGIESRGRGSGLGIGLGRVGLGLGQDVALSERIAPSNCVSLLPESKKGRSF